MFTDQMKTYFVLNKAEIDSFSYTNLDSIAQFLIDHRNIVIEVGVHVDTRASNRVLQRYGRIRAAEVINYLIEKGAHQSQLIGRAY